MPLASGRIRVGFDEDALSEDLARLSPRGQQALRRGREEFERDGIPAERLLACHAEHSSGTDLPGCLKTYLPDWNGEWRMVFQIAADETGLLLSYLAGGVGHQPRGARAPDVYQIAHHRLYGRWL